MAKYGKWIGAGLGLALGGPLGALFGLFIGSMFDNIQTIAIPSDGGPIPPGQTGRGDFTFSLTVLATAGMKAMENHPDKVGHLGEDIRKAAEEKFSRINVAYEKIKKQRGMN